MEVRPDYPQFQKSNTGKYPALYRHIRMVAELNNIEKTRSRILKSGKKIMNLSSGNPNEFNIHFPLEILGERYSKFIKNSSYNPLPEGSLEARKAIQKFYKKRGYTISRDQILITSSTSESYFHLFKLLAPGGETILFPKPTYPLFEEIARLSETTIQYYDLDPDKGWQINMRSLEKRIKEGAKAIVIISPSNPTGSVIHKKTLEKVLELAQKYSLPIISDEVFSEFIFTKESFPRIAQMSAKTTIFTLNGLSKTYALPGYKLSWIIVSGSGISSHMDHLSRSIDTFLSTNQIAQYLLPTIIEKGDAFIKSFQKRLKESRTVAIETLNSWQRVEFLEPEGGFYLFIKIKNPRLTDEELVIRLMQETGIFVHPGYFYDYDEKGVYILITLLKDSKKLKTALEKIKKFL